MVEFTCLAAWIGLKACCGRLPNYGYGVKMESFKDFQMERSGCEAKIQTSSRLLIARSH